MAISNVAATGTEVTAGSRTRIAENFDTFLTLLTAQMRNQDPLSPMDSTQFTQQMVQMTGVEQQLLTNDLLKTLVNNSNSGISTAVSLIGKEVRAVTDTTPLQGGKAEWVYKLDREAAEVTFEVVDAKGAIVHSKTVLGATGEAAAADKPASAGEHVFTWDGKGQSGQSLPEGGAYTLRVKTKDTAGESVPTSIFIKGIVAGVEQADGKTLLTVNGAKVPWDKVASIFQPVVATAPTGTGANDNTDTASGDEAQDNPSNPAG
jgi:flagellar basal-body rod modification protein FlgD